MRSVTASYYSQKSVHSILSTLENHTSENQIDFKTSIHITRCSHAQSPMVLAFLQWNVLKLGMTPLPWFPWPAGSFKLSHQLTPLHSISNHLTSLKLFKTDMQNLTLGLQAKCCHLYFSVGNILPKLPTPPKLYYLALSHESNFKETYG